MKLVLGDCLEEMAEMAENSVDAIVCDPPYGLEFMGKEWDKLGWDTRNVYDTTTGLGRWANQDRPRYQSSKQAGEWHYQWAIQALRVLKPGGHLLAFGGTRTHHRLMCALEDAGFEIRDTLCWLQGQGFPKSKSMRDIGTPELGTALKPAWEPIVLCRKPISEKTVAANCLKWGTGALAIDECRIGTCVETWPKSRSPMMRAIAGKQKGNTEFTGLMPQGRWPANLVLSHTELCKLTGIKRVKGAPHLGQRNPDLVKQYGGGIFGGGLVTPQGGYADADGMEIVEAWQCTSDCPVRMLDEQSGLSATKRNENPSDCGGNTWGGTIQVNRGARGHTDSGGASRFFYCAKVSPCERWAYCADCGKVTPDFDKCRERKHKLTIHPTQKPEKLIEWLVKLVAREGQTVMDCFAGSGTTGVACKQFKRAFIGIEREETYFKIAEVRINAEQEPML